MKDVKQQTLKLDGVECIYRGPKVGDVRKQDKIIEDLINEGVDGIAVSVIESTFLARSSFQKAKKAGIPIITYDSDFDEEVLNQYGDLRLAYVGTNNFQFGWALGMQLKELRPEGGRLLIQTGRPDSPNLNLRIMGLRSALSEETYMSAPGRILKNNLGWTEVREPIPNYDKIDRSVKQLESVLRVQPTKVDAFVAVGGWPQNDDAMYRKMIKPFQEKLDNKEIVLVISDASTSQLKMLGDNLAHANIGQRPFKMGQQALLTLLKIVKNQAYEDKIFTPLIPCTPKNYDSCIDTIHNN
ncbi:substrate-binding domain-containing protein [Psychromonas sp. KJ10-10]|uniref:substrate-binding domain-containing protein n=1 Tax=Psychromonas sp. KJ10-10 TaxID=3391823 RepID=UPI0039B4AD7A